jgi:hypothetical protein
MALKPYCPRAEWIDRAAMALGPLLPLLGPAEVGEIAAGHLWDEACDWPPEEAAREYARNHDE